MFIIKERQRLSSGVIEAVALSFFLAAIIIFGDKSVTQAYPEKKTTIPFYIPLYVNINSALNLESTSSTINISSNDSSNDLSSNLTGVQQALDRGNNTNTNGSSYLTYEDNADGISLMYPSNWQKIEYPSQAMNYGQGHRIIVNFLAPLDPSDQWRSSINVQVSNRSDLKNIVPQNANITAINLAGHPAFKSEYTSTERMFLNRDLTNSNLIKLKVMQVWTTIRDNTYVLTFNSEPSKYQQYLPVIQKILSSFKIS